MNMHGYTERIFELLDADVWMSQQDILKRSRMAAATALAALQTMVADGEVEQAKLLRGAGAGSGGPKHIYRIRRRQAQTEAAA